MSTRTIELTDEQAQLIEQLVASGRYKSAREVVRESLRLLHQRDAEDEAKLAALREAAQVGIDDIEAGRYTALETPEEIRAHIARLTRRATSHHAKKN